MMYELPIYEDLQVHKPLSVFDYIKDVTGEDVLEEKRFEVYDNTVEQSLAFARSFDSRFASEAITVPALFQTFNFNYTGRPMFCVAEDPEGNFYVVNEVKNMVCTAISHESMGDSIFREIGNKIADLLKRQNTFVRSFYDHLFSVIGNPDNPAEISQEFFDLMTSNCHKAVQVVLGMPNPTINTEPFEGFRKISESTKNLTQPIIAQFFDKQGVVRHSELVLTDPKTFVPDNSPRLAFRQNGYTGAYQIDLLLNEWSGPEHSRYFLEATLD